MFARLIFEFKCRTIDGMTDPKLIELTWAMAETVAAEQQLLQKLQATKELAARWTERERVAVEQKDRPSAQKARTQEKYFERKVTEIEGKLSRVHNSIAPRRAKIQAIEQRAHEERVRKLARENKLDVEVARLKNLITNSRNRAQIARTQGSESMEKQAIDQCAVYQRQLERLPTQK